MNDFIKKSILSISGLAFLGLTPKFVPNIATDYFLNSNLDKFLVNEEVYEKMNLSDEQKNLMHQYIETRNKDFEAVRKDCEPKIQKLFEINNNLSMENIQNNISQSTVIMTDAVQKISNIAINYSNNVYNILNDEQQNIYMESMSEARKNIEEAQNLEIEY